MDSNSFGHQYKKNSTTRKRYSVKNWYPFPTVLFFSAAKDKDGCGSGNDGDDEEDYGLNTGASSKHKVGFIKKWTDSYVN